MSTQTLSNSVVLDAEIRDWTRVVSPGTSVSDALAGINSPSLVEKGVKATKVARNGSLKKRVLTLSKDRYALFVTHKRVADGKKGASSQIANKLIKTPFKNITGIFVKTGDSSPGGYSSVRYIDVADINGIQEGVIGTQKLEIARKKLGNNRDEIVTLVHHANQTVDVTLANQEKRKEFVRVVKALMEVYHQTKPRVGNEELLLRYIWYDIDSNRDGSIGLKEFLKILLRINFYTKNASKIFKNYCKEMSVSSSVGISYHQLMCLIQRIKSGRHDNKKKDILSSNIIWDSVFGSEVTHVSSMDFLSKFLIANQHETDAKIHDVEDIFRKINMMEINREKEDIRPGHINRTRFEMYLHHESNDAYDPKKQEFDKASLDEPISKYWINSSHNTYLTGDQLRSTSSVECYMSALRRGCKCLELDCWDGEKNFKGVPVVFHGHTLTSKIAFEEIILGVKGYVQSNPDTYPIILSLENHCSHPCQHGMATMLKQILGKILWSPNQAEIENGILPSPASLRGKVIVKGKHPSDTKEEEEKDLPTSDEPEDDPYKDSSSSPQNKKAAGKKPKIVKELADLTLFHGTKYKSFETSIDEPPSHMHSITEPKIDKILNKGGGENAGLWRSYNVNHMTRTYPSVFRVDSSNYNPVLAWSMGSQLVALNFQTSDTPLLLNDGLFKQNGGCGYVKKPPCILGEAGMKTSTRLRMRILCGSCLPKPHGATEGEYIDPYVLVSVHDVKNDNGKESFVTSKVLETESIDDNGFCPMWNQSEFKTATIHNPDVAMIEFSLKESDPLIDDKVANASIPFSCLRRGYRSIQLYDTHNTRSGPFGFATLVVEIDYDSN